ncbi:MAG: chorismate synthase [Clostridiales bacterium]|nr:chorismate synthase [Clostridiales bacterium]
MSSSFGKNIKVSVFGQSHGKAIGVVMDNVPAGHKISSEELQLFMDRRKPGKNKLSTGRKEGDVPVFLSGLENDMTCGSPICAIIENSDQRSKDYDELKGKPRPGHADYTAYVKWDGQADMRGGGHFSGRLTAPLCIAGGIAKQILMEKGIVIGAHILEVAGIRDESFPCTPTGAELENISSKEFPVINDHAGSNMIKAIEKASQDGDSVGGIIECVAIGIPEGLGGPMFEGIESRIASAVFGIPAIKGIEFGAGFSSSKMKGSEHNDPMYYDEEGSVKTKTNNAGGILGGITNGMPVVFKTAVKPTPSISRQQETVDLINKENTTIQIKGRHDPCIVHRAVPVVEAVAALVILDMLMEDK